MPPSSTLSPVARWLLILILTAGIYFFYGFLIPVLAALIIGFASWPLFDRLLRICKGNTALAASIAVTFVLIAIVAPLGLLIYYGITEIIRGIAWVSEFRLNGFAPPEGIKDLPFAGPWLYLQWTDFVAQPLALGDIFQFISGEHISNISRAALATGRWVFDFALSMVFVLITLFFLYKDGQSLVGQLDTIGERILPERWNRISRVVPETVSSTVTGMTLIAIGEGIVLGTAYSLAGIESALLLGIVTGVMALVPGGAPLAMTSVSLYLVLNGSVFAGIALFLWGTIELFVVDKTIRPKLVGGPIRLPFLPTLFGLIGGVKTMGIVGLFIGPVLMALLVSIWREWVISSRDTLRLREQSEQSEQSEQKSEVRSQESESKIARSA